MSAKQWKRWIQAAVLAAGTAPVTLPVRPAAAQPGPPPAPAPAPSAPATPPPPLDLPARVQASLNDDHAMLRSAKGVGPYLEFVRTPDVNTVCNRAHLDLVPYRGDGQAAEVARLQSLGATPADVGRGDVPWVVLADPEGNEFCVLAAA